MWIESISLLVNKQNIFKTGNAPFATRRDVTLPNIGDTQEREDDLNRLETSPGEETRP